MNFYDINSLIEDTNLLSDDNRALYNFFNPTFQMLNNRQLISHTILPGQEMRMDILSNEFYNTVDYCDFLCSINDIDNPLNVMINDIIFYVDESNIESFRIKSQQSVNTQNILLNSNKLHKIDSNRQEFIENNNLLPSLINDVPKSIVSIDTNNGQLIIQ